MQSEYQHDKAGGRKVTDKAASDRQTIDRSWMDDLRRGLDDVRIASAVLPFGRYGHAGLFAG
jgi:hypothetical protein